MNCLIKLNCIHLVWNTQILGMTSYLLSLSIPEFMYGSSLTSSLALCLLLACRNSILAHEVLCQLVDLNDLPDYGLD